MNVTPCCVSSTVRAYGRGLLARLLSLERLLTRILVGSEGQVIAETQTWREYWASVYDSGLWELTTALDSLYVIWRRYISSGFLQELQTEYCYAYFHLLELVFQISKDNSNIQLNHHILIDVVSFECFGISSDVSSDIPIVAGTTTLRNPCYLLTKRKIPGAIDDCQYLPLITCAASHGTRLYYSYRQHKITVDSDGAILLYVCTDQTYRQESFKVLNHFERFIWHAADPRVTERAKLIAHRVIIPYLALKTSDSKRDLEVIDIGAGSGLLTARICRILQNSLTSDDDTARFRVWMVDLHPSVPSRFFGGKRLRQASDWLTSVGIDYHRWLVSQRFLPKRIGTRIGFFIRVLQNMSNLAIEALPNSEIRERLGLRVDSTSSEEWMPWRCLHPDNANPQALQVSTTRIELDNSRSVAQMSLSPYFRGLSLLAQQEALGSDKGKDAVYLPLQSFNQESLLATDGSSILERVLRECSMVIIQDMDLRPQHIYQHCDQHGLRHIAIIDIGKELGSKSYYSYIALHRDDPAICNFKGVRIW